MNNYLKTSLAITASSLILLGCDSDGTSNKGAVGFGTGALVGAAIGSAVTDDPNQGAAIGSILGGVVGGVVGNQLEEQENALRQSIGSSGVQIVNTGDRLILTLPEAITFPVDSAQVKPSLYGPLSSISTNLQQYPNSIVQVVGHTDNTGSESYNQGLSNRRAESVANIILSGGVSYNRVRTLGMGERVPIASNDTASGRQANRRVEINIIPVQ